MKKTLSNDTINKTLNVLIEIKDKLSYTDDISLGKFMTERGFSGSFGKLIREKAIITSHGKKGPAMLYTWSTKAPDRQMAIALMREANRRTAIAIAKRKAKEIKLAEELFEKQQQTMIQQHPVAIENAFTSGNVVKIDSKEQVNIVEPIKSIEPIKQEPVVSQTTTTQVTTYFFKWLRIKKVINIIKS